MKIANLKYGGILLIFWCFTGISATAQEGRVSIKQDKRIEQLLDIRKEMNRNDDGERRYRIQIYNGNLNGARNAMGGFKAAYSDWPCDIRFETPNYKVWVGKFRSSLEAERYLIKVKERYPNAFIPKPR